MAERAYPFWLPSLLVTFCVAAMVALAVLVTPSAEQGGGGVIAGALLSRAGLVTAQVALMSIAVALILFWSMGLWAESLAVRLVILVPLALSVGFSVVLMLDSHVRGPGLTGGG